jgi:hypothetical protein
MGFLSSAWTTVKDLHRKMARTIVFGSDRYSGEDSVRRVQGRRVLLAIAGLWGVYELVWAYIGHYYIGDFLVSHGVTGVWHSLLQSLICFVPSVYLGFIGAAVLLKIADCCTGGFESTQPARSSNWFFSAHKKLIGYILFGPSTDALAANPELARQREVSGSRIFWATIIMLTCYEIAWISFGHYKLAPWMIAHGITGPAHLALESFLCFPALYLGLFVVAATFKITKMCDCCLPRDARRTRDQSVAGYEVLGGDGVDPAFATAPSLPSDGFEPEDPRAAAAPPARGGSFFGGYVPGSAAAAEPFLPPPEISGVGSDTPSPASTASAW